MAGLRLEILPENAQAAPRRRRVAVSGDHAQVLLDILRPEVNPAIWHRDLPDPLAAGLRPLVGAAPFASVVEDIAKAAVDALAAKLPAPAPLEPLFDIHSPFARASQAAGWAQALSGQNLPESEESGIASFVWRARRPVHPARFKAVIEGDRPGVVRAKGFFWLATRMPWAGSWQRAGPVGKHEAAGFWWAAQPDSRWPIDPEWRRGVMANWQEPFGDRRQEIVIIGVDMDEAALRRRLDACLLTEAEMRGGPKAWDRFPDPFPGWRTA